MNLFVFFALPFATILLAIVLQKILKSPILVAITFFAIYLIVAFVSFSDTLAEAIIAAIIYTIIAYITAVIVKIIKKCFCINRNIMGNVLGATNNQNRCNCSCGSNNENDNNCENNNLLTISCSCGNGSQSSNLLTVDSRCSANNIRNNEEEGNIVNITENTTNAIENCNTIRPVALGNNIVNRNNMPRRVYRRW